MSTLFWILFVADLLLCLLVMVGKSFRDSFGASSINTWFTVLLFIGTVGGFVARVVLRKPQASLVLVSVPVLVMFVWYLIDSRASKKRP